VSKFSILTILIFLSSLFFSACPNPFVNAVLQPKTATFETNGGSDVPSQIVYKEYPIRRPSNPVKSGHSFIAWYEDNDTFENEWNFNTVPNRDITLYANWIVGAVSKTEVALAVPVLTISGTTASWTAVPDADTANGYTIKIGTTETQVTGTSYSLVSLGVGTYQISVKTNGYETETHIYNASAYCAEQSFSVKAAPTVTWPSGLAAVYGQILSDIPLTSFNNYSPGIFTWTTPANSVGAIGTQTHNMTFTPTDTANYNTLTKNVDVTVVDPNNVFNITAANAAGEWVALRSLAAGTYIINITENITVGSTPSTNPGTTFGLATTVIINGVNGSTITHSGTGDLLRIGGSGNAGQGPTDQNVTINDLTLEGPVLVDYNSTFTMNGGAIKNNTTTGNGGGVYVSMGTFIMNGGEITGNSATTNGGGVFVLGGLFIMNGGTISGNTATSNGGGVYVGSLAAANLYGTFIISNGTISGNSANVEGDQLYVASGGTAKTGDGQSLTTTNAPITVVGGVRLP